MEKEKLREEIDEKYKWDLTLMYKTEEEYNKDFAETEKLIEEIPSYKGIIAKDAKTLYDFLILEDKIDTNILNMFVYKSCILDQDISNKESTKEYNRICNLYTKYQEVSSFVNSELLKTDYNIIKNYINDYAPLKEYSFDLEQIYRFQPYILSEKEEILLSNINDLQSKFEQNFTIANNSLIDFGTIKDEDGNKVKLTIGNYAKYIRSKDRNVRKSAFINRSKVYKKYAPLLAVDYEANVKSDSYISKARGYKSSLDMFLFPDGVTEDIYNNLLKIADDNLHVLHKYYKLIKDTLKLDKLQQYDLSAPLIKESNKKYFPEDCKDLLLKAFSVYGKEYQDNIKRAFDERWIDFYPNKAKRSGYYENDSSKGIVVLGNYNDDYESVSSIAHELGHAMQSYYSSKNNPSHLSRYSVLVAEIASLTNEMILSNYVINNTDDKNIKLQAISNILNVFSNNFFGTLADGSVFEKICHEKSDNGEALSESDFNDIFEKIIDKQHGNIVQKNEYSKYNWARVPHFYSSFYYYKYSIGVSIACYTAKRILNNDKKFIKKYIEYLSLGGSMMPLDELKVIGVDLTKADVILDAINYFDELIDKFKEINNS